MANFALEHHYVDKENLHARCVREPVIKLFPRVEKVVQIRYKFVFFLDFFKDFLNSICGQKVADFSFEKKIFGVSSCDI